MQNDVRFCKITQLLNKITFKIVFLEKAFICAKPDFCK